MPLENIKQRLSLLLQELHHLRVVDIGGLEKYNTRSLDLLFWLEEREHEGIAAVDAAAIWLGRC